MTRLGIWRYVAGAGVCGLLWYIAFRRGERVPLLEIVDLAFHELGHFVTYVLPEVVTAMAGSVAQVAVPLGLGLYFLLIRRDLLGAGLCLAWAATSAQAVSVYIADANYEELPLIGTHHDWATALGPAHLDALRGSEAIASHVRQGGQVLAAVGFVLCAIGPVVEALRAKRATARVWSEANAGEFVWSPAFDDFQAERPDRALR